MVVAVFSAFLWFFFSACDMAIYFILRYCVICIWKRTRQKGGSTCLLLGLGIDFFLFCFLKVSQSHAWQLEVVDIYVCVWWFDCCYSSLFFNFVYLYRGLKVLFKDWALRSCLSCCFSCFCNGLPLKPWIFQFSND